MNRSSTANKSIVNPSPKGLEALSNQLQIDLKTIVEKGVGAALQEFALLFIDLLIETEVQEKSGKRYQHDEEREVTRWGKQKGAVYAMGQKLPILRQRLRSKAGEVELESYKALNDKTLLNEENIANMMAGVSTRKLSTTVETLVRERGVGRMSVSRRGVAVMSQQLDYFKTRTLADKDIVVIFIDGINVGERLHVAAVGVDRCGKKHLLGFHQGATENSGVCKALIADLVQRGLKEEGEYLFVVDGGKGLAKAIKEFFGARTLIQRCLVHKIRNLHDYLPKSLHTEWTHRMHGAFNQNTYKAAEKAFDLMRRELLLISPSAANSLIDGLQELLTLHRLGIKGVLRKSLCTTNSIESIFASARYYTRNVKRWRTEEQMERWLATGLLEAEKKLKKIPGYTQLPALRRAIAKQIEKNISTRK